MTETGFTVEQRPWRVRELAAWGVIVFSVLVLLLILAPLEKREDKRLGSASESPDLQVLMAGRYVVGVRALMPDVAGARGGGKGAATLPATSEKLSESLDKAAKTPLERLQLATVRGELDGREAALKEIEAAEAADPSLRKDAEYLRTFYTKRANPAGKGAEAATMPEPPAGFQKRFGWFGELAKSFGKPDTDEQRAAVLHAGERTFIVMIVGLLLGLGALMVGLVLLITAIVLWFLGKMPTRFEQSRPLPVERSVYVEAFAAFLSIYILGTLLVMQLPISQRWGILLLPLAVTVGIAWPVVCGQTWSEWRAAVGLHTGRGFFKELACGALGYLAGLPLLAVGAIITMAISKATGADPTHPISRVIRPDPVIVTILLLLASVWAPITEELMFRGTLFAHLRERWGWWGSALLVSLVFAIIHPQGLAGIPVLASIALMLAAIREWRGSILGCMMAHCINNTIVLVMTVMMMV